MSTYTLTAATYPHPGVNDSPSGPYKTLGRSLAFPNLDEHEWWHHTAPILEKLLIASDYDVHQQYQHLTLYGLHVIPLLGPFPHPSRPGIYLHPLGGIGSFELSQNFTASDATTAANRFATDAALARFKHLGIPFDPCLYHRLVSRVSITDEEEAAARASGVLDNVPFTGQILLGLDLNGSEVTLKLYFPPVLKAVVTGTPPLSLACDAVRALDSPHAAALPWIEQFVATSSSETLAFFSFSCDLVAPAQTRFKFYFSETLVTFDRIADIWTLNGRLSGPETDTGMALLQELWDAFNIPPGQHEQLRDRARVSNPATAYPLLFNLEIHPSDAPQVKIYFPVAGVDDAQIADALDGFFARHGFCKPATMYKTQLSGLVPGLILHESTHLQIWVSFAYLTKKGAALTVYYH